MGEPGMAIGYRRSVMGKAGERLWSRVGKYIRDLKKDMERNSVSAAGPSSSACCHAPVEELEKRREMYRGLAKDQRRTSRKES